MVDSQTLDHRLVRAKVVREYRLAPVTAREIAESFHEAVRIALDEYVQPQNLACRGVRDHADDRFLALHANRGLVHACHGRAFRPASCDVAPRAHAREGDAEGGAVGSLRALPEGAPAVGASAADGRDLLRADVYNGLVGSSSLGEDWAAAALAGVGSFVVEGLDLRMCLINDGQDGILTA